MPFYYRTSERTLLVGTQLYRMLVGNVLYNPDGGFTISRKDILYSNGKTIVLIASDIEMMLFLIFILSSGGAQIIFRMPNVIAEKPKTL